MVVVIEEVLILVDRKHDVEAIPSCDERLFPKLSCGEPFAKKKKKKKLSTVCRHVQNISGSYDNTRECLPLMIR